MALRKPGVIALFDVDGTLTAPRKVATPHMLEFMRELKKVITVGVVGGSDLSKITEQLGKTGTSTSRFYILAHVESAEQLVTVIALTSYEFNL